jgi:UDP-N-acetylglucosamine acyltransferase
MPVSPIPTPPISRPLMTAVSTNPHDLLDRLCFRYPASFVDALVEHEPGRRLVATKNVSVNEDFFQGHFPGAPVLPGVLMIETFAQAAAVLLLGDGVAPSATVYLRAVVDAKFRRQVVPGDQVRIELTRGRGRGPIERVHAEASVDGQAVSEAELLLVVVPDRTRIDPTARVHPGASIGDGTVIGPQVIIGERVCLGRNCEVGASSVIEGCTEIGDGSRISPFVSIGLAPQDLKYRGEATRVVIGRDNIVREFVTIHRGTAGGGGVTRIGDRNLFMAYSHVAHDCHVGSDTIFGNGATLGGHVHVEDFATVSAMSGVHQFCRVGRHAFIGAASAVTRDALPFARTVGNRARIYGLNVIGLVRRGVPADVVSKLRRAYRYLLVSKLRTSAALARIEADPALACAEVQYLVEFIRGSERGVILRRASRRADDVAEE